ncbi:MAG: hypothetical protein ACLTTW_04350 [Coprobacter sp.]
MKIKDCIVFAKCVRNPDSPLTVDVQTVHGENSTCAYHQNEELSSKDVCFKNKGDIVADRFGKFLMVLGFCNWSALIIDIPDSYIEAVRNCN